MSWCFFIGGAVAFTCCRQMSALSFTCVLCCVSACTHLVIMKLDIVRLRCLDLGSLLAAQLIFQLICSASLHRKVIAYMNNQHGYQHASSRLLRHGIAEYMQMYIVQPQGLDIYIGRLQARRKQSSFTLIKGSRLIAGQLRLHLLHCNEFQGTFEVSKGNPAHETCRHPPTQTPLFLQMMQS